MNPQLTLLIRGDRRAELRRSNGSTLSHRRNALVEADRVQVKPPHRNTPRRPGRRMVGLISAMNFPCPTSIFNAA
jgi:hypothetical protein